VPRSVLGCTPPLPLIDVLPPRTAGCAGHAGSRGDDLCVPGHPWILAYARYDAVITVAQQHVDQVIRGREATRTCPLRACTAIGPSDPGSQAVRGDDTRHGFFSATTVPSTVVALRPKRARTVAWAQIP